MIYNSSCTTLHNIFQSVPYQIIIGLYALSGLISVVLSILIFYRLTRRKTLFHANVKILTAVLLLFSNMFSIGIIGTYAFNIYVLITHESDCEAIFYSKDCHVAFYTVTWGLIGLVTTQACLSVERAVSTRLVYSYELEGKQLGLKLACASMIVSLGLLFYGLSEVDGTDKLIFVGEIPSSTARTSNILFYVLLLFDVVSLSIFILSWRHNKRKLKNGDYSLAKKYQVTENFTVIKMFLPLVVIHFCVFGAYIVGTVWIRHNLHIQLETIYKIGMTLYVIPWYTLIQNILLYVILGKEYTRKEQVGKSLQSETRSDRDRTTERERYFQQMESQWK